MAGFLTTYVNNMVVDHLFGGNPMPPPVPVLWIGLSHRSANRDGQVTEPSWQYTRVAVPNDKEHFTFADIGSVTNTRVIDFGGPAAPCPTWGTIKSVFVADEQAGGNVLAMADLPKPVVISLGDSRPRIAVAALFVAHA